MPKKPTPRKHFNVEGSFDKKALQITRKKELLYHYKSQIYKLTRKAKAYQYQIDKIQAQIKDYEKAKSKVEKWLKG